MCYSDHPVNTHSPEKIYSDHVHLGYSYLRKRIIIYFTNPSIQTKTPNHKLCFAILASIIAISHHISIIQMMMNRRAVSTLKLNVNPCFRVLCMLEQQIYLIKVGIIQIFFFVSLFLLFTRWSMAIFPKKLVNHIKHLTI